MELSSTSPSCSLYAVTTATLIIFLCVGIALGVLLIIANWKIFQKGGHAGWKALIPLYNGMVLFKIIYGSMGKYFLTWIPFFGIVYTIISLFRLAKVYGKGVGFGFGLLFLPNIFTLILGFGNSTYIGPFQKEL